MLDRLVASAPVKGWSVPGTLISLMAHAGALYLIAQATVGSGGRETGALVDTMMVFVQPESPDKPAPEALQDLPAAVLPAAFKTIVAPVSVPTDIPPIDLQQRFDPRDYTGVGKEIAAGDIARVTSDPGPAATYAEAAVDEKPEIIMSPPLKYPAVLRQAGIEGSVLIEVVIDTLGHAERASVRVVQSTHPGFDKEAMDVVTGSLYRPGRMRGHVVRVLVNVPVSFTIRKTA